MATLNLTITDDGYTEGTGTTWYASTTYLWTGSSNSGMYGYLKFDLSGIPEGATVESAVITLTGSGTSAAQNMWIYRVTEPWTEAARPNISSLVYEGPVAVPATSTGTVFTVDVTTAVNNMLANGQNYGVALRGSGTLYKFNSTENATVAYRPTAAVTYSEVLTAANVSAPVATANAVAVEPAVSAEVVLPPNNFVSRLITENRQYYTGTGTSSGLASFLRMGKDYDALFKLDVSEFASPEIQVVGAVFNFDSSTAGVPYRVLSVDSTWSESSTGSPTRGAVVLPGGTTTDTDTISATNAVDITTLVKQWVAGTRANNGFALSSDGATTETVIPKKDTTGYDRPSLSISYYAPGTDSTFTTTVALASVTMPGGSVDTTSGVSVAAGAATGTAEALEPVVTAFVSPDATFAADVLEAAASMGDAVFSAPTVVFAGVMHADALANEATVETDNNARIAAGALKAGASLIPPAQGQFEEADPYFIRIAQQTGDLDAESGTAQWYRFNETGGATAKNRLGYDGLYSNVGLGQVFGLEGRRAATFNGINSMVTLHDSNHLQVSQSRMEIVFRTTKADQVIVSGSDFIVGTAASNTSTDTSLEVRDGRIFVNLGRQPDFIGNTRVDDGQWHHVVWITENVSFAAQYPGTSTVYIDGQLDMRRALAETRSTVTVPDHIGAAPGIAPELFFEGDIMEYVFNGGFLSHHDTTQNYYAAFGITPVYAGLMTASAEMPQGTKGKGNQKRALMLFDDPALFNTPRSLSSKKNWTGIDRGVWNNPTGGQPLGELGGAAGFDLGPFRVFTQSVHGSGTFTSGETTDDYLGGQFYDKFTGERRYIDLLNDTDLSEYDMVFFHSLPSKNTNRPLYEQLINGLRAAQDEHGFSLWVPQPELAIELGVIDRLEEHSMMRESLWDTGNQGNASGLYDYRSALVNPWESKRDENAKFYYDNHALNRYRLNAVVEGLTTINGHVDDDFFYGRNRDPFKGDFAAWKTRELTNGLQIGDEWLYPNQDLSNERRTSSGADLYDRFDVTGVPAANVKAGTILTRENATHWVGKAEVANPYRDNATSIVLQPGNSLKGRPVGGRIYVNFMEGAESLGDNYFVKQLVPDNSVLPSPAHETDEMREWSYSSYRVKETFLFTNSPVANADPSAPAQPGSTPNPTQGATSSYETYPTTALRRYGLMERALLWLADKAERGSGDKVIRVAPATATATMSAPGAKGQRSVSVGAQSMVSTATAVQPTNFPGHDVGVLALPFTASARMTGYGKKIAAESMAAHAEWVENFDLVMAGGEQVVVFLHYTDAELYLMEDV